MTETVLDSLVVRLRADASELKRQVAGARQSLTSLGTLSSAAQAGLTGVSQTGLQMNDALARSTERVVASMTGAFERFARTGKLSFQGLKQTALSALADIAAAATRNLLGSIFGGGSSGGGIFSGFFGNLISGLFGLRAGGGPVSPRQPFVVGERGPEIFTPAIAGRITPNHRLGETTPGGRVTNISINVTGTGDPDSVRRSAGQVAAAVRQAVERAERNL